MFGSDSSTPEPSDAPPKVSEVLKASQLRETLQQYGEALRTRRKGLDRLNVYPVPDGDTGTNMSLTVQSVVAELASAAKDDMSAVSTAISRGAIMGARGNSGAILAQTLRGFAESVKEKTDINPADVADALERGRKGAYESVVKPVEGTILTVLSAAATAARKSSDEGHKLKEQLDHVRAASAEALARTPELLPQLKQAGVVDAGGSGFLLFVDALRFVATGEPIPGAVDSEDDNDDIDFHAAHGEISDLRYEVMFLLDGVADNKLADFKSRWAEVGDSIVVVGGESLYNCHIHADDIGPTIEIAQDYGKLSRIRITDLLDQVADRSAAATPQPAVETAIVAVVNGTGLERLYKSFGVQGLITGGQSMNPSVSDLLASVNAVSSDNVLILPNNKNIFAAAKEVDGLTEKTVTVVKTESPVQGLSALVAYDSSATLGENTRGMDEAFQHCVVGEITQAVRDTTVDAGKIVEGDWLGISPDGITVIEKSLESALVGLLDQVVTDESELVTLLVGQDAVAATTDVARQWLADNRADAEVQVETGGQPLYPYLVGVE